MTIDVSTALWVLGALFAVIGTLIGVIWSGINSRLKEVRDSAVKAHERLDKEVVERTAKQTELAERFGAEISAVKGTTHDLDVTIAGFGGTYATRTEILELRRELTTEGRRPK